MGKSDKLAELYEEYRQKFEGFSFVPGEGNVDCRLLLVGEAPGKDEVRLFKPFVGMAGKNLDEFLNILGVDRSSIYITNAIKYRLAKENKKTGGLSNRPATADEIKQSRDYLISELKIINPEYVVTLGNVPLKSITGNMNESIGKVHGEPQHFTVDGLQTKLFPLFHPASIIYNRSLKDVYIKDIEKLGQIL